MRDQNMFFRNRAGRGQKPWGDAQLQRCVVWGGDWPLWFRNRRNVSMSPTDSTRALTFHPTNPRTYSPSPPTAWLHPAIWSCMISSAGRGMPWERQCRDAHTQTRTRTHIRLQPSASSAPLHALSFVSSTFFLKPTKDLAKARGSSVLQLGLYRCQENAVPWHPNSFISS